MTVAYKILPRHGIVYVNFSGHIVYGDSKRALEAFGRDPLYRPGLHQIIDLTAVTGFEPNYAGLVEIQARKADLFPAYVQETLNVYIAPGETAQRLVTQILRSWEGVPGIRHSVTLSEAEAMDILGLAELSVAELIEQPV